MSNNIPIYIDDPNYLDTDVEKLNLIQPDETFVELPESNHKGFYISQYGRLYSKRRRKGKLLKDYWFKSPKGKYKSKYALPSKEGKSKWFFTHRLVASVYCKNIDPKTKDQVHHKDKDVANNHYRNLQWVSRSEHRLLESGRKIFVYGPKDQSLINKVSLQQLCEDLKVCRKKVYKVLYSKKYKLSSSDGSEVFRLEDKMLMRVNGVLA